MKTETGYTLDINGVIITIEEKEKHSVEDLKQHLVDYLLNKKDKYALEDVTLIKVLLEDDKKVR